MSHFFLQPLFDLASTWFRYSFLVWFSRPFFIVGPLLWSTPPCIVDTNIACFSSATTNPPTESSFSFTPIKALSALPRLWDRKPSTPVRAGDKSRKLWKRIRFPFGGMKTESEGQSTGIGAAKNPTSDYQRGVKRRCVDPSDAEQETEMEQRGRSFLETKWEMQASRKKRESSTSYGTLWHPEQPTRNPMANI